MNKKVWFLLLLGTLLLPTVAVSAHADLVKASPAADEHLEQQLAQVDLYFSEEVEPSQSVIAVFDTQGTQVDLNDTHPVGWDKKQLAVSLSTLRKGHYVVSWQIISSDDGHATNGSYAFSLGAVTGGAPITLKTNQAPVYPAQIAVKGVLYLGTAWLVGGMVFLIAIWGRASRPVQAGPDAENQKGWGNLPLWRWMMNSGLLLSAAATLLGVIVQGVISPSSPAFSPVTKHYATIVISTLLDSRYGRLALERLIVLGLLAWVLTPPPDRWNVWVALPLSLFFLLTISLESHAAALAYPLLPIGTDLLHLAAASIWVGGLVFLLASLLWSRRLDGEARSRLIAGVLARFSPLAFFSVGMLGVTGAYEALLNIDSINKLTGTEYGQALIAKIALALVLILLGGYNHFVLRRRFEQTSATEPAPFRQFRRSLMIEAAVGAILLLWVGIFTSLPLAH